MICENEDRILDRIKDFPQIANIIFAFQVNNYLTKT